MGVESNLIWDEIPLDMDALGLQCQAVGNHKNNNGLFANLIMTSFPLYDAAGSLTTESHTDSVDSLLRPDPGRQASQTITRPKFYTPTVGLAGVLFSFYPDGPFSPDRMGLNRSLITLPVLESLSKDSL